MLLSYGLLSISSSFPFSEQIRLFHSNIHIAKDGSMKVHETIIVDLSQGKRGILRDFPVDYKDIRNFNYHVDYAIEKIECNHTPVPYQIEYYANKQRVKIGDALIFLNQGTYTYDIYYTTSRQLGFFDTHDELYWNVTGNECHMPILHASACVTLPEGAEIIQVEGYTGYLYEKGAAYTSVFSGNTAELKTTKSLYPQQGFTIVVCWPKGIVDTSSAITTGYHYLKDNAWLLLLVVCWIALLSYCAYAMVQNLKDQNYGTIIPLFYPPAELTPAQMRYLTRFGYDHKVLATHIIDMAIHGYLTIEHKKHIFGSAYILKRTNAGNQHNKELWYYYKPTLDTLFGSSETITLDGRENNAIAKVTQALKNKLMLSVDRYFKDNSEYYIPLILLGVIQFISYPSFAHAFDLYIGLWLLYVVVFTLFYLSMRGYNVEGRKLFNKVEGFKLFLTTTEEHLHTKEKGPIRTPELFEKYLPYAMALGVEKQWASQFEAIFATMAAQKNTATFAWYYHDLHHFTHGSFTHNFNSKIQQSAPGSHSGSDGGGCSGGGGGGGGVSSW